MSFLKGVLAGLAIGYLTAPRSGKETRDQLTQRVNDLQDQWDEGVAQVKSQIDSLVGNAENKVDRYANQAEKKVDHYKNEVQSSYNKERAKNTYNNKVDDVADAAKSGINNAEDALKIS
ncbi:YtxH domain-containing protein [Spirosoma aureum]|uniref:YtxH domain-containing protein n=1 Tax=Spirosoma aureum TaxID=2692134 RepID=A0A6G9AXF1_9BACT|nr:YtxH domain-containing protein [Spirosoma aureum]QIP16873.1 YtxH domain-containing protein [Spirosoma aureum]